jgi:hypothetical protein
VSARRVSKRKLKEVMRLRFELHLVYQQIGRGCAIGVSTVHKYLKRAEAAGLTWPLPENWDEARVEAAVYPPSEPPAGQTQPLRSLEKLSGLTIDVQLFTRLRGPSSRARFHLPLWPSAAAAMTHSQPDFAAMHEQLRRHRHLTLQLLWEGIS